MEREIEKHFNELSEREYICDVIILINNLSESAEFHTIKVLGKKPETQS